MNAQQMFDKHRKAEGLKTFPLSKGQIALIEDTQLPFLIIPKEERAAAWAKVEIKPMPTFLEPKVEDEATRRFRRLIEIDEQRKKDASLAKLKERFTKEKAAKPPKQALGAHIVIKIKDGAKRAPGTKAAARFDEMAAYMKSHPKASVADVIANTGYRVDDYKWDLAKGNIKGEPIVGDAKPVQLVEATAKKQKAPKAGAKRKQRRK